MKSSLRILWLSFGLMGCFQIMAQQPEDFSYYRTIEQPENQWHKISLPIEIYEKISPRFSDLRVYGTQAGKDTLESPYLVETKTNSASSKPTRLKVFNQSSQGQKHFFTFEVKDALELTELELKFRENNFNWEVDLEGSNDLTEWFSISKKNRIVSILNKQTGYTFSTLSFPPSRYRYYRVSLNNKTRPVLLYAEVYRAYFSEGEYIQFPIEKTEMKLDEKRKKSIVDITLKHAVPISCLKIKVNVDFDYYRPLEIKYLADSTDTPKGIKYYYKTLHNGFLSSFEKNEFYSSAKTTKRIQLIINNEDNQPIDIEKVVLLGHPTELTIRFREAEKYYLYYGNKKTAAPRYDIASFKNTIPINLKTLKLSQEEVLIKKEENQISALFTSKFWLWGIMILVIGLLGWFTFNMMKDVGAN